MGRQIIKKANGRYAVWSTVIDDFIWDGITKKQYVNFRLQELEEEWRKEIEKIFKAIAKGEARNIYHQFTMTYEEALKLRSELRGKPTIKTEKENQK
jgi:hypothetical protein